MSYRGAMTAIHGMLFGAFFLLATYAMVLELLRLWHPQVTCKPSVLGRRLEALYLVVTAASGWFAVLSGTYLVYPWYRAAPPAGADIHDFPRALLLASASTAPLHTIGMEWKEHVAFIAPMVFTALAWIFIRYSAELHRRSDVRRMLLVLGFTALLTAAVPGAIGAFLNKAAPTAGPRTLLPAHTEGRA